MTIYLHWGLWLDRHARRPCGYFVILSLILLLAAVFGLRAAWSLSAACACVGLPPILLMFLFMKLHNFVSRRRRRKREKDES